MEASLYLKLAPLINLVINLVSLIVIRFSNNNSSLSSLFPASLVIFSFL